VFASRCVQGMVANKARCGELVERSMSMVTALSPLIGYDRAAKIAHESAKSGRTIRQVCTEEDVLPPDQLDRALDPVKMCEPHGINGAKE
jgi:fumarate hydratase class II